MPSPATGLKGEWKKKKQNVLEQCDGFWVAGQSRPIHKYVVEKTTVMATATATAMLG